MGKLGEKVAEKLKTAIRVKLMELGVTIENELPDYIMVLIANKKTQKQMENDLELFLGSNTNLFTTWLYNVTKKLEEVTVNTKDKKSKKPKTLVQKKESEEITYVKENENIIIPSIKDSINENRNENIEMEETIKSPPEVKSKEDIEMPDENLDDIELRTTDFEKTDEIDINSDNALLLLPSSSQNKQEIKTKIIEKNNKISDIIDTKRERKINEIDLVCKEYGEKNKKRKSDKVENEKTDEPLIKKIPKYNMTDARDILRKKSELKDNSKYGKNVVESKIKKLPSVTKVIIHKDVDDKVQVQVPSLIKVTPRPKRPLKCQANKTLLLRAVADAEKSVATAKSNRKETVVKDKRKIAKLEKKKSIKDRLDLRRTLTNHRTYVPPEQIKITLQNDMVSSSNQRYVESAPKEKTNYVEINNEEFENEVDWEEVECYYPDNLKQVQNEETHHDFENDIYIEEDDTTEYSTEYKDYGKSSYLGSNMFNRASDPRYVIHLGSDSPEDNEDWEEDDHSLSNINKLNTNEKEDVIKEQQVKLDSNRPLHSPIVVAAVKPYLSLIKQDNNEMESNSEILKSSGLTDQKDGQLIHNNSDRTKLKMLIRCKFWPDCVNQSSCQFFHPTENCKLFPSCKLGDQCLYIHPVCKYVPKCVNGKCLYSHVLAKVSTKTKFSSMTFKKPCKFGKYCTNSSCPFHHQKNILPTREHLKWSKKI